MSMQAQRATVILGPRRTGKTMLLHDILAKADEKYLLLNGEDHQVRNLLQERSVANYTQLVGDHQILAIDEAQAIKDIGLKVKLMIDHLPGLKVVLTGSSSLDLMTTTGEPLTGRKQTFNLFPFSEEELDQIESPIERVNNRNRRLIYGSYPELIHLTSDDQKKTYLKDLVQSYLLKDILALEGLRRTSKIISLLQLVAFQVGSEVSLSELGNAVGLSKETVEKYLYLLEETFVLYRLGGFSRNLRKEVTKSHKWYFIDNGIRNAIISNFAPLNLRNDVGALWENYAILERIKYQHIKQNICNNYFWRTYDQQEIDWVEDQDGTLSGFEMKYKFKKRKPPVAWTKAYPTAGFEQIHIDNIHGWVR